MPNYDSRRVTISYLAVEELQKMFGISEDAPTQALSAAVEKLIFSSGGNAQSQAKPSAPTTPTAPIQPNKIGLANMAKNVA